RARYDAGLDSFGDISELRAALKRADSRRGHTTRPIGPISFTPEGEIVQGAVLRGRRSP
ncbi:MAG: hypothetical protein HC828_17400, partial [Blastochloris sp.]|nr:hypothetical protein [Blastochloris sp.]